jgi:hypothetical protein
MTSRRMLKKRINTIVNNIIEECYSVELYNKDKHVETNKIVDETVAMLNDLLARLQSVKSITDKQEQKKHYDAISADLEKSSLNLIKKLDKI